MRGPSSPPQSEKSRNLGTRFPPFFGQNSEKYSKSGKILQRLVIFLKIRKNSDENKKSPHLILVKNPDEYSKLQKIHENSEKYLEKLGKILVGPKQKRFSLHFG